MKPLISDDLACNKTEHMLLNRQVQQALIFLKLGSKYLLR